VDKRHHTPQGGPRSDENILQGANILKKSIDGVKKKHPDWSEKDQLQGGIAAYNFGVKNVQTVSGIDKGTTGGNYSQDILKRADFYRANGYTVEECNK